MAKLSLEEVVKKKYSSICHENLKPTLRKNHACYILITCQEPEDGNMEVEMSYEGDEVLASYLLESAQNIFQNEPPLTESLV